MGSLQMHITCCHLFLDVVVPSWSFLLSLSLDLLCLCPPGTHLFYHCISTDERAPAILLGSSPQPGDFLRTQYEIGETAILLGAAALHCIKFRIRSPSPLPPLAPPKPHDDCSAGLAASLPDDGSGVDVVDVAESPANAREVESKPPMDPHIPPEVLMVSSNSPHVEGGEAPTTDGDLQELTAPIQRPPRINNIHAETSKREQHLF